MPLIPGLPSPYLIEPPDSRSVNAALKNPTARLKFKAVNATSREQVRAHVYANTPVRDVDYPFLWRNTITVTPLTVNIYDVVVDYAVIEGDPQDGGAAGTQHKNENSDHNPDDKLGPEFSFDTTGGQAHVQTSITTVAKKATGGNTPPDFAKSINVTKDGVHGLDKPVPKFEWAFTGHFPFMTHRYHDRLKVMTGMMNKRLFFGRWAGECLFLGASARWRNSEGWTVTFKFSDKPTWGQEAYKNRNLSSGQPVGTAPTTPQRLYNDSLLDLLDDGSGNKFVKGWDYVWVLFEESTSNGRKIERPYSAYVEKVFHDVDFYWLGIGGAKKPPSNDLTPPEEANF